MISGEGEYEQLGQSKIQNRCIRECIESCTRNTDFNFGICDKYGVCKCMFLSGMEIG